MERMIDQIRASKLPARMMQFAARGALSVPPDENLEILVYLARNNKIFGDLARITLAGWDEKASEAAAADPNTAREVLDYLIAPENVRPKLLPALLENPSVSETELARFAQSASPDNIAIILRSERTRATVAILESLRSNPYLKPNEASTVADWLRGGATAHAITPVEVVSEEVAEPASPVADAATSANVKAAEVKTLDVKPAQEKVIEVTADDLKAHDEDPVPDEAVSAYLSEHATEISAEEGKPFQPIGGIIDLLGSDYFPVSAVQEAPKEAEASTPSSSVVHGNENAEPAKSIAATAGGAHVKPAGRAAPHLPDAAKRDNSMQKINRLDVKGRIQLALKGNKEERSILIRDGTKVVALAVLEAPKLSDGEVEKFALQKNVLEAVLRQIPLKRRFMKNYIVVRNLVANPRTPLDLGLGLMKHLLPQDLKNISANKEVSETVRKLAMKMYKQKLDAAAKK
jgi:hypothetical protein